MCNLYHVAPESSLENYIRRHLGKFKLWDSYPPKPRVGPFDTGMFMVADGEGGLVGRFIRPGHRNASSTASARRRGEAWAPVGIGAIAVLVGLGLPLTKSATSRTRRHR